MTMTKKEKKADKASSESADKQAVALTHPEELIKDFVPTPDYPHYRVETGDRLDLSARDPDASEHFTSKEEVKEELKAQRDRIADLQARLYGEQKRSLLIVLQATDTGGKDGTIKGVFKGVNPQGCRVHAFKQPGDEEAHQDFLWRYHRQTPPQGMISIFNRSHYEDVLVVRVKELVPEEVWKERFRIINEWEHSLCLANTTILKFYLHISKDEQKRRLESRLHDPKKQWKFSSNDIKERLLWDKYQVAFEEAITRCSTSYAPWYVVPANKKWYRNLVIARTIADTLEAMNPQYPPAEKGLKRIRIPD
ncbi:MAG: polyphosphate kinase 2 family protein [Armatimonadota bacterium]